MSDHYLSILSPVHTTHVHGAVCVFMACVHKCLSTLPMNMGCEHG